jgi:N-acetylated-alpha-linked acidic dipeptidase
VPYPEGGWANDTCIQRGSINTLDQPGDPLTPGMAATRDATRLDPDAVGLPRIPVQPIGYRAAQQIMQRMSGQPLPEDLVKTWQGGLPMAYRLTGGEDLRLRLMVKQQRRIKRSANVIATLRGTSASTRTVYVGSHHDAWGFGAGDPAAGGILALEAARSFAKLAKRGLRPQRSIAFCFWGAEEFGIIGSSEYCEQHADALRRDALAYINLDGAAMGTKFSASSDPMLKTVIEESACEVLQARDDDKTVFQAWKADKPAPPFGDLGGGSDHIGFYCHLGIPSCFLSSMGAPGTAYHSNYDNLAWYRRTVGEDYEPALMLTRLVNVLAARLANAPVEPLDPARYAADLRAHFTAITELAQARNMAAPLTPLVAALERLEAASARAARSGAFASAGSDADSTALNNRNAMIADLCKLWQPRWPEGLPGRPWFRNFYAASDPNSGYSAWVLPALRAAIESGDDSSLQAAVMVYVSTFDRLTAAIESLCEAAAANRLPEAAQ